MSTPVLTAPWTSAQGLQLTDLVPAALRRAWSAQGHYPDQDIYRLFAERVRAHPDRPAVRCPGAALSYRELGHRVRRIALELDRAGVSADEVVGIQLPGGWQAVAAELAVAAIGAVALTFPAGRGTGDTYALLDRSRAAALLTAGGGPPIDRSRLRLLRTVLDLSVVDYGEVASSAVAHGGVAEWSGTARRPDPDSPARILVSSGSESEPKMVAYSHNAMAGGRGNYLRAVYAGTEVPCALVLVPLSSSYGSLGAVTLYRHGGTLVLLDGFDAASALRAVTEHRPTHLFGVATMLRRMTALAPEPGEDLSSLRSVIASCDGLPAPLLAACLERFGAPVSNLYGSTDGMNCRAEHARPGQDTTLLGRPDPAVCDLRICDEQGVELPPGEPGEVWALGPMTPLCYVGSARHDERYRRPGGWVRSGDHGLLTADGRLQLLRRNSQLVKRGGYSISPAEVERHAAAHPGVAEAACVAVPDPDLGERLCVCVVPAPATAAGTGKVADGAPTLGELNAFLEAVRGLERRKLPEQLLLLTALPLGPTGKLARAELSALATAALS